MKQNHQKSWAMAYCGIVAANLRSYSELETLSSSERLEI